MSYASQTGYALLSAERALRIPPALLGESLDSLGFVESLGSLGFLIPMGLLGSLGSLGSQGSLTSLVSLSSLDSLGDVINHASGSLGGHSPLV